MAEMTLEDIHYYCVLEEKKVWLELELKWLQKSVLVQDSEVRDVEW